MAAAYEIPGFQLGVLVAKSDLSAKQYYGVNVKSTGDLDLPAASGEAITGILQNAPLLGEAATCMVNGVSKGILGGTVTAGDDLMVDAAGKFRTATTGNGKVGKALQSGVASDVVAILLIRGPAAA